MELAFVKPLIEIMKTTLITLLALISFTLYSCNNPKAEPTPIVTSTTTQPSIGAVVPNETVCMVNNAYMGRKQLEVEFEGKIYYGCCEDCKTKIPQQEIARIAIDPVTGNSVDKSTAVIAIKDSYDNVVYFENEANYKTYFNL